MPIKSRIMNNRNRNRNKSSRVRNNYRRINLKSNASKRLRTKNNNRRSKHRQFGGRGAEELMEIKNIDGTDLENYLKNELGANAKYIEKGKCTGKKRKFESDKRLKVYKIKVPTGIICVTEGEDKGRRFFYIRQIKGILEQWDQTREKPTLGNDSSNRFDAEGAQTVQTLAARNNLKRVANRFKY
jgi:hypothetical protein